MYQYQAHALDSLLKACLTYLQENPTETYFMVGNVAGRDGVDSNVAQVKKMLDSIVEADTSLVRYEGVGTDGVPYYSLGPNAASVISGGGFTAYFQHRKWLAFVAQLQVWSPILISIGAFVVSVLAWQIPKSNDEAIQTVNSKIDTLHREQSKALEALKSEQERTQAIVTVLGRDLEARKSKAAAKPKGPKK
jgi:hypothetical protein